MMPSAAIPCARADKAWLAQAIRRIRADMTRSADTHLVRLDLNRSLATRIYLKDESTHPTGSLKHRLARSLFLYAICNGWIGPDTPVIESSSGSTAVSEAYFARLLGLRFIAVMPRSISPAKVDLIRFYGGECHFVERGDEVYAASARLASELNGHYMDQFTYAERATDWRGNNNIAESIFDQMRAEETPVPDWIVCGAGTGGTSATLGRYIRYNSYSTRLCLADPEASVFHRHLADPGVTTTACTSTIEGIGRGRVEPSFIPEQIDRWIAVPDAASVAAARWLSKRLGRRVGGSTGTNLVAVADLVEESEQAGRAGAIVTLLCDSGERYAASYFDDAWIRAQGYDLAPETARLDRILGPA
ncbi:MAG TPA: PLP-dependent cysteine synthase family protein [Beijerinckiaceae bacterium]|nr:PLP-dependent cysteine synthase family protein [Beijerinckiaceae bacterium]